MLPGKKSPRFVVTPLSADAAAVLYERIYCAHGEMESRSKEQPLDLFADRTRTHTMRANQLRLWLASLSNALINVLRRVGLADIPVCPSACRHESHAPAAERGHHQGQCPPRGDLAEQRLPAARPARSHPRPHQDRLSVADLPDSTVPIRSSATHARALHTYVRRLP